MAMPKLSKLLLKKRRRWGRRERAKEREKEKEDNSKGFKNNLFELVESSYGEDETCKLPATYSALADHGVTSINIAPGYQSPLYFESPYYAANLIEQRWIARRTLILSLDRVFNWSLANQIESEFYMTLPSDLSSIGRFLAHCWLHVDASGVDNGIARLLMQFAFGFNSDRRRLIGLPREEALLDADDDDNDGDNNDDNNGDAQDSEDDEIEYEEDEDMELYKLIDETLGLL
jgi:hypothetical protein